MKKKRLENQFMFPDDCTILCKINAGELISVPHMFCTNNRIVLDIFVLNVKFVLNQSNILSSTFFVIGVTLSLVYM